MLINVELKASIPMVSKTRIRQKFQDYHQKYRNLLSPYKECKDKEDKKAKVCKFREDSKELFDIAACKCNFKSCHSASSFFFRISK